jgi:hypothetical protein
MLSVMIVSSGKMWLARDLGLLVIPKKARAEIRMRGDETEDGCLV